LGETNNGEKGEDGSTKRVRGREDPFLHRDAGLVEGIAVEVADTHQIPQLRLLRHPSFTTSAEERRLGVPRCEKNIAFFLAEETLSGAKN
jgi:hypothetical protein